MALLQVASIANIALLKGYFLKTPRAKWCMIYVFLSTKCTVQVVYLKLFVAVHVSVVAENYKPFKAPAALTLISTSSLESRD